VKHRNGIELLVHLVVLAVAWPLLLAAAALPGVVLLFAARRPNVGTPSKSVETVEDAEDGED